MPSPALTAPWQVGPVSAPARIAAAALAALAFDSLFTWQASPHFTLAIASTAVPILVGIRVLRGFPRALAAASATFTMALVLSLLAWGRAGQMHASQLTAALTVAVLVSATGLGAGIVASWTFVMRFVHETHDFLRTDSIAR